MIERREMRIRERQIEDLLTRPRGRPSHAPLVRYRSFHYQAASWERPRRVIAKIEHHLGVPFTKRSRDSGRIHRDRLAFKTEDEAHTVAGGHRDGRVRVRRG